MYRKDDRTVELEAALKRIAKFGDSTWPHKCRRGCDCPSAIARRALRAYKEMPTSNHCPSCGPMDKCVCPACFEQAPPDAWRCANPNCNYEWDADIEGVRPTIEWLLEHADEGQPKWSDIDLARWTRHVIYALKESPDE
jgi:hypothetical protein